MRRQFRPPPPSRCSSSTARTARALALSVLLATAGGACGGEAADPADAATDSDAEAACGPNAALTYTAAGRVCACVRGYAPPDCLTCAPGYEAFTPGGCLPDAASRGCTAFGDDPCGHGTCDTSASPPVCRCDPGYVGARCATCDEDYVDNTRTGVCAPDGCKGRDPGYCGHGYCSSATTPPSCVCQPPYAGPTCGDCDDDHVWSPEAATCVPPCTSGRYACSHHGACVDTADGPACTCDAGYLASAGWRCAPAQGASCADPIPLDLAVGYAESTAIGGAATLASTCKLVPSESLARVFRLSLPSAQRVRLRAASPYGVTLAVRTDCAARSSELACLTWVWSDTSLEVDLPAGDAFVVVEGWPDVPSSFGLEAVVLCPPGEAWDALGCAPDPCVDAPCSEDHRHACRPDPAGGFSCACDTGYIDLDGACVPHPGATGATCADALALPAGRHQQLTLTSPASDDAASNCNVATGAVFYLGFDLPVRSQVRFYATAAGTSLTVSVRRACAERTSELLCASEAMDMGAPALTGGFLDAGSYVLVVDGAPAGLPVALTYDLKPDPCHALAPCAPGLVPTRNVDWTACACACPEGQSLADGACVSDPCLAAPCAGARSRCVNDAPAAERCQCPLDQLPDAADPTACVPDPAAAEWTVIVYHSYDNNLGSLLQQGPPNGLAALDAELPIDVVWLAAIPSDDATIYHAGHGAPLAAIDHWDAPDMADWRTLRAFGVWAARRYPAHHTALVVVDHGGGLSFSWDQGTGDNAISIPSGDYARALTGITTALGAPLDVVDFETCLLATWEVAEATRPYARALLGSPEIAYGMNGMRLPDLLAIDPTVSLADLGRATVDASVDGTQIESWTDLTAIAAVTDALNAMADAMRARPDLCPEYDAVRNATPIFSFGDTDIAGFADGLAADGALPTEIRAAADALAEALADAVYAPPGERGGLSIYLPPLVVPADADDLYRALPQDYTAPGAVWAQRSTWDELLVTCRQRP